MHLPRILISVSLSSVLLGTIGCAPTAIVGPAANTVRVTHNEPGAECQFLGDLRVVRATFCSAASLGTRTWRPEPVMI